MRVLDRAPAARFYVINDCCADVLRSSFPRYLREVFDEM